MEFLRQLGLFRDRQAATQTAAIRQGGVNGVGVAEVNISVHTNAGIYRPTETGQAERMQRFQEGEVESLADTAVRGLEQMYWRVVQDLAEGGSERAVELLVTRVIMRPTSMTQELAMALGVHHEPPRAWEDLLDLMNERSEAYHNLRTELFRRLWCGGPAGFVDPEALDDATDEELVNEVGRRPRSDVATTFTLELAEALGSDVNPEDVRDDPIGAHEELLKRVRDVAGDATGGRRTEPATAVARLFGEALGYTEAEVDRRNVKQLVAEVRALAGAAGREKG